MRRGLSYWENRTRGHGEKERGREKEEGKGKTWPPNLDLKAVSDHTD